jgi:hypothetical protein
MRLKAVMSGLLQSRSEHSPLIPAFRKRVTTRSMWPGNTRSPEPHSRSVDSAHPARIGPLATKHWSETTASEPLTAAFRPLATRAALLLFLFLFSPLITNHSSLVLAQTESATLSGRVTDPSGASVVGAEVVLTNMSTNEEQRARTNGDGIYVFSGVQPGLYRVGAGSTGFKTLIKENLVLHTQDEVAENFSLSLGSVSESVSVSAEGNNINTADASVSTVVDRNFVDNMPLNGRSFQSLILLAPGAVTATPQNGASQSASGEFSVNGQRADANNFSVDGVSANNSPDPYGYSNAGSTGGLPATTALGTTQALISVDALQEFKIQTSTYSAEYGRQPGAQISFQTRSGTNDWHGSAFEYLRNTVFDANNWFNDETTPVTPKPAERQNDFGGTLGGPLGIPWLYSGKDRTFFFFSYEGLHLTQPQPGEVFDVPSTQLREEAPVALQPVLNAFPMPNCTTAMSPQCVDPGDGLSPFFLNTSLPSNLDAISVRVDERVAPWLNLFFRYGSTSSSAETYAATWTEGLTTNTQSFTLGGESTLGSNTTNEFRLNYSPVHANAPNYLANYGGAVPVDLLALSGVDSSNGYLGFFLSFPGYHSFAFTGSSVGKQDQWNIVETLTQKRGSHLLKAGIDYRRTGVTAQSNSPQIEYFYTSSQSVVANSPRVFVNVPSRQYPEFTNFSAFVQDEWRATRALSFSLGLRWELNPAPGVTSGPESRTIDGDFNNPATLTLAPAGTPLYHTTHYNFAPRVGMAAMLRDTLGYQLVFRAGGGVFYDTGQQLFQLFGSARSPGTGFDATYAASPANAFPLSASLWNIPPSVNPPYSTIYVTSQHLQLPYTLQWNATLEQALGKSQSISLGYIGANGRRLLDQNTYSPNNSVFSNIVVYQNGLTSSYNALQAQYKRTISRGLQALASYTWSHALDYESQDDGFYPYKYGNSDFDVRNNFTAALSYSLPSQVGSHFTSVLVGHWGIDVRFTARSGFPVTLFGNTLIDPVTGLNTDSSLNLVPGQPIYIYGTQYPGGRSVNPAAFTLPQGTDLGNAPRNFVRGFGETEINFAVRREFPVTERLHLQFRAEAFNLLNHPNFGYIDPYYGDALFGQATETLASSIGGLTSLYQQGGPRSFQFSLRLQF